MRTWVLQKYFQFINSRKPVWLALDRPKNGKFSFLSRVVTAFALLTFDTIYSSTCTLSFDGRALKGAQRGAGNNGIIFCETLLVTKYTDPFVNILTKVSAIASAIAHD